VVVKRAAYLRKIRRVPVSRLVFLDESGMNLSMSRSHAWVKRGEVDPGDEPVEDAADAEAPRCAASQIRRSVDRHRRATSVVDCIADQIREHMDRGGRHP